MAVIKFQLVRTREKATDINLIEFDAIMTMSRGEKSCVMKIKTECDAELQIGEGKVSM